VVYLTDEAKRVFLDLRPDAAIGGPTGDQPRPPATPPPPQPTTTTTTLPPATTSTTTAPAPSSTTTTSRGIHVGK
ncbi:MAG: hypothetical protein QOD57_5527, partial [Actinomycetota bacterium]|nr:hypothetical protein [Actinomycetota bacterium]